jgi:hypothetical protein
MYSRTVIATTGKQFSGFAPYVASINNLGMVAFQTGSLALGAQSSSAMATEFARSRPLLVSPT